MQTLNSILTRSANFLRQGHISDAQQLLKLINLTEISSSQINPLKSLLLLMEKKIIPKRIINIVFGSHDTIENLIDIIRFSLLRDGILLNAAILPIGTWEIQAQTPDGALSEPYDYGIFFFKAQDICGHLATYGNATDVKAKIESKIDGYKRFAGSGQASRIGHVIYSTIPDPQDRIFGNYDLRVPNSPSSIIDEFNRQLISNSDDKYSVFDLNFQARFYGLKEWYDYEQYDYSKHPFSLKLHGAIAEALSGYIKALIGQSKKAIVVDLDNTLWGGVIGDDGAEAIKVGPNGGPVGEAYYRFQKTLKAYSDRGVMLAVCSKNDEKVAKDAFATRTDMPLGLDDFTAFVANWDDKATNLRRIARTLNIATDAIVFIDDNPLERSVIRCELPDVTVIELPDTPHKFSQSLVNNPYFDMHTYAPDDALRIQSIKMAAKIYDGEVQATDLESLLKSLGMRGKKVDPTQASIDRCAQLFQKTNQFQVTGHRPSKSELLLSLAHDPDTVLGWSLKDNQVDHGIVTAVLMEYGDHEAHIRAWVMSCRVFSRTLEQFVLREIAELCIARNIQKLSVSYRADPRNRMARDALNSLGLTVSHENAGTEIWAADCKKLVQSLKTFVR